MEEKLIQEEYELSIWRYLNQNKVKLAVEFLNEKLKEIQTNMGCSMFEYIKSLIDKYGEKWAIEEGFHMFNGGMFIRNLLRSNGFHEEYMECENLDYIYVQLLELAINK